jgi:multidrug efflux pump subunit AcrA (membrane-fusion protein)
MTAAEQQALAQARARIEHNLAEIAALARDGRIPATEFFPSFLKLAIESLDAMGGAIWVVSQDEAHRVAEISFPSSGCDLPEQKRWMDRVIDCAVSTGKPCIVAVQEQAPVSPDSVGNAVPYPFFYTPVATGGKVCAVLQVWLKQAGDPRTYADIAAFLAGVSQHVAIYMLGLEQSSFRREQTRSRQMLAMQESMLGELDPKTLMAVAANYLVDLLPCALGAVLQRRGRRWHLIAASNQEAVDPAADQSQALARLATVLPESATPQFFPSAEDSSDEGIGSALEGTGYRALAWCHLPPSKKAPHSAVLLACWHDAPPDNVACEQIMGWACSQLARSLDAATHFHHIPLRRTASAAGRIARAWQEGRQKRVYTWVVAPLLLILGALLFPAPNKIKADCAVVPAKTASVVAETEGKIVEVSVAEGEVVRAGQILAKLEDTDYAAQLAASQQQLSRYRVEAARAQALGNEPERKIAELAARREEHNIERLEYLRSRTDLVSPIDGVLLTRGVQQRGGEAMEKGKLFCEVGSLGSYELQLDLRQQDLGPLLGALSEGRHLPVDFILHAHARQELKGEISGAVQISQLPVPRAQETVFLVRIPFPENALEGGLKAGYTGKASIYLGRRPWGWLLLRPFAQYWRMNWSL